MEPRVERIWYHDHRDILPGWLHVNADGDYRIADEDGAWQLSNTSTEHRLKSGELPYNCFRTRAEARAAIIKALEAEIARLEAIRARIST